MIKKTVEIDTILLDLNRSVDAHYQWLVKMFRCVVTGDKSQPDIVDSRAHCKCHFGQWLKNHSVIKNDEREYVHEIKQAHMEMHMTGRELMQAVTEKCWTTSHFERFEESLLTFTANVMQYKIYLVNLRSNMDILTGLPGRRILDETFDRQLKESGPLNLYVLLLDIDRFKSINDAYGHLVGDVVLRMLSANLTAWTRHDETPYRYGGEEFVIAIRAKCDEEARQAGLRLCQSIAATPVHYPGGTLDITATGGVTRAWPGESLNTVLGRADKAMYEGKQTGRNRCMFIDNHQRIVNVVNYAPAHAVFTKQAVA
ncbi:diguanylate cyclase [Citrobacter amalonaticus]|uniref:diguanylate cyclase n=1 Tax=Citrobacter amalonaticus TaxID=35703 RepID=UPI00300C584B